MNSPATIRAAAPFGSDLLRWIAILAIMAVLLFVSVRRITGSPADPDSSQSLLMAVNLAHQGVMSLDDKPPYQPGNYREPIPIAVSAVGILLIDALVGPAPPEAYASGERLKYLKFQNLLWLVLLWVGVFWFIHVATRSFYAAFAGASLASVLFAGSVLDSLLTDTAAAAMLALASAALATGLTRARAGRCITAGALFGALVLIKAAVLYVFIGMLALLIAAGLIWRARIHARIFARNVAVTALALVVVVVPWMLRNKVELGTFQVTQRAGVVLMIRAVKDLMSPEEYVGAFYVWSPHVVQPFVGKLLGFGPGDLQRGGRLQHLNRASTSDFAASDLAAESAGRPQDAISFYRQARAERVKLVQQLEAAGTPKPDVAADKLLQQRAVGMIEAHPWRHLAVTIPFLWRGAAAAFPILLAAIWLGLRRSRYDCVLLALPSFGLVMFYALLSHFIPRYGMPVTPILVALLTIGAMSVVRARSKQPA